MNYVDVRLNLHMLYNIISLCHIVFCYSHKNVCRLFYNHFVYTNIDVKHSWHFFFICVATFAIILLQTKKMFKKKKGGRS